MNIEILPSDWDENNAKLNTPDKYSLFKTDLNIPGFMMGKSPCGCYAITVNPGADDFSDRLFDYIAYEKLYNRRPANVYDKVENRVPREQMKLNSGLSSEEARERILYAGIAVGENISRKELDKTFGIE